MIRVSTAHQKGPPWRRSLRIFSILAADHASCRAALETAGVEFIPENCGGGWGADAEGLGACTGADTPHGKRNGNHKVVVFALPAEDTRPLVGEGRLEIRKFCF